jgi:hypothetical protein
MRPAPALAQLGGQARPAPRPPGALQRPGAPRQRPGARPGRSVRLEVAAAAAAPAAAEAPRPSAVDALLQHILVRRDTVNGCAPARSRLQQPRICGTHAHVGAAGCPRAACCAAAQHARARCWCSAAPPRPARPPLPRRPRPPRQPVKRAPLDNEYVVGLVLQHRTHLILATVCLLLCTASNLAAPVLSGLLFETLVQQQPMTRYAEVRRRAAGPRLFGCRAGRRRRRGGEELSGPGGRSTPVPAAAVADAHPAPPPPGVLHPAGGLRAGAAADEGVHGERDRAGGEGEGGKRAVRVSGGARRDCDGSAARPEQLRPCQQCRPGQQAPRHAPCAAAPPARSSRRCAWSCSARC